MLPSRTASTPSVCPARIESSSLFENFITTLVGRMLNPLMLLIRVISASASPTLKSSSSLRDARLLNGKTAIDFTVAGSGLLAVHQKPTLAITTAAAAVDTVNVRRRDSFLICGTDASAAVLN